MRLKSVAGNLALALAASLLAVVVAWSVLKALGRDPMQQLSRLRVPSIDRSEGVGIWRDDSALGFAHIPGARGRHESGDFSVAYGIGPDGCRVVPDSAEAGPALLFLGGSFTFGHGVEDGEAYPAVLAQRYWQDRRVRNCGVMAWGTSNAYVFLSQEFEAGGDLPAAVFYGWHASHPDRNYLSKSWLETLALSGRRLPHFEIEDGRLDFRGTVGVEAGLERTKSLNKQQRALTRLFLREMDRLCRERGIPFVVLVLGPRQDRASPRNDRLLRFLEASQIRHLDLRGASDSYFPEDGHPTPDWHRAVARAIAEANPLGGGTGGRPTGKAQHGEAWSTKMGDDQARSSAGAVQSSSREVRKSP